MNFSFAAFIFFLVSFHFFAVSLLFYMSTGIRPARAPKEKDKYPATKKRAESMMEKIRICQKLFSFWVWLLEKAGEEKTRHLSSGTNLLGRERRKIMEQKKIEKHGRGKKKGIGYIYGVRYLMIDNGLLATPCWISYGS